ncbi:SH3 domain-containing protein [Paenisporosarcina antarctica]|uniref:N-acetylmuramoyl-L-alanine amidase n=1 Tax=Paenisporosarcina antarctica TaxID=417367 RepID=A0A4P6ZX32_9BACL|nr:SH3 domain-containing protein [Paenisporosarcina antarctica]QBP40814.1 N-acetylmuramoyl-L-alanine amidase [Paenisporosarcina antarctica]
MRKFKLQQSMQIFLALILLLTLILPSITQANGQSIQSTVSKLNIRSGPGLAYPIIASLQRGDQMLVLEQQGDWTKIRRGSSEGWVASWYTKKIGEKKTQTNQLIISKVNGLNVRSQASIDSAVLTQLSAGDQATLLADYGQWVEISTNQVKGYVAKDFITIQKSESTPTKQKIVNGNHFEVAVDRLNVRSKPDLTAKKVSTVSKGERYKIIEKQHNWVKIQLSAEKSGWVYSFYGTLTTGATTSSVKKEKQSKSKSTSIKNISIVYNGTNLRESPSTASQVVYRANAGESFKTVGQSGDFYEVTTPKGATAYVANWVVSTDDTKKEVEQQQSNVTRKKGTLNGLTLVIDPGHGGNDHGTTGVRGTDEKGIALRTSQILANKLRAAGANVVLTRDSDVYVDLRKRVALSHQLAADAFISVHYDATDSSAINGFTTYYTHGYQKNLAQSVNTGLGGKINLRDRGAQPGNYFVLRENRQLAILIELGFLSNPSEERAVTSEKFREQASLGIYNGVINYFDNQLNK